MYVGVYALWLLSSAVAKKVRILDVVYNASNNELVRTKTLVKGAIVLVSIVLSDRGGGRRLVPSIN